MYKLHIKDKSLELREDDKLVFISSNRDNSILNEIAIITEIILKHKNEKYISILGLSLIFLLNLYYSFNIIPLYS